MRRCHKCDKPVQNEVASYEKIDVVCWDCLTHEYRERRDEIARLDRERARITR